MGTTGEVSVAVDTVDCVLRADDLEEETTEVVATMGDVVEEDSEIDVGLGLRDLTPRADFWNEDNNSFIADAAIPLEVGFNLFLQLGQRVKNRQSILSARSSDPFNGFFSFVFDGAPYFVIGDDMVDYGYQKKPNK